MGAGAEPVLVTGATGYLGSRLVRTLLERGECVAAVVRPGSHLDRLAADAEPVLIATAMEASTVVRRVAPRGIVHCAAPPATAPLPDVLDAAVALPAALAEGARGLPRPPTLVELGSWWEWDEVGRPIPANSYAAAKTAGRAMLAAAAGAGALRLASLIPHDIYGPDDWRGKVLDQMVAAAREGAHLSATPGRQVLDWVHVDDVIGAILDRLDAGTFGTGAAISLHALGHERLSLRDVAALISKIVGPITVAWGAVDYPPNQRMAPGVPHPPPPDWRPTRTLVEHLRGLMSDKAPFAAAETGSA